MRSPRNRSPEWFRCKEEAAKAVLEKCNPPGQERPIPRARWGNATVGQEAKAVEEAPLILVVEDNPDAAALVERWLVSEYQVMVLEDAESCMEELERCLPATICLDLDLPGQNGLQALYEIRAKYPHLPVIILTANLDVTTAVDAIHHGAYDYLPKPLDRTKLKTAIRNAVDRYRMGLRLARLERETSSHSYSGIVGRSEAMRKMYCDLERVASSEVTVLIQGESGTGKELVARALHDGSQRSKGEFVAVNCAAIPENLLESEFFGHERGAFTGATNQRKGRLEKADGGTLFLDEVAELDPALQAKLLRALQEKAFHRVGGTVEVRSDFRVVTASHRDLATEAAEGRFREDLYFRLAVFELELPPLRDRGEDLEILAESFLQFYADDVAPRLSNAALELLQTYAFPGNVRELQNAMQRAVVVCQDGVVLPEHLPARIRRKVGQDQEASEDDLSGVRAVPRSSPGRLRDMEKRALLRALEESSCNIALAARSLGIGRTTIYRKMKKFGIDPRALTG
ncbi:MAG: sigma-54 dependent transcriptional regulator [Polyangiaceae bacterium]|nr:sigma-54 dependent transcriptional regulator [Polyangiaceae bacterium]